MPGLADVVVAIPVKDKKHFTYPLLMNLIDQGEVRPEQIVVYDNGSTDGTRDLCEPLGVVVIDATGWSLHSMWNDALSRATTSPVAILNNDITIGPNFISAMVNALDADPSLAVVCPNYDGRVIAGDAVYVADIQAGRMDGSGGIAGWAYMVAPDWAEVFRFPEELRWWYGDNVLVDSIVMADRRCGIVSGTTVVHIGGGSQTGNWTVDMVDPDRVWYYAWRERMSNAR